MIALAAIYAAETAFAAPANTVGFYVLKRGDDGLTNQFTDAVIGALQESQRFSWSGAQSGTLQVSIDQLLPNRAGNDFPYSVQFSLDSNVLGVSVGTCSVIDLESCAQKVVKDADAVTLQMR